VWIKVDLIKEKQLQALNTGVTMAESQDLRLRVQSQAMPDIFQPLIAKNQQGILSQGNIDL